MLGYNITWQVSQVGYGSRLDHKNFLAEQLSAESLKRNRFCKTIFIQQVFYRQIEIMTCILCEMNDAIRLPIFRKEVRDKESFLISKR